MFSGGLDSLLAARLLRDQGIELHLVTFLNPFHPHLNTFPDKIRVAAATLGVEVSLVEMDDDYLDLVRTPKHGYGKNINPCIDCRIYQLKRAKKMMEQMGASFLATGEVLGERPMSQRRDALQLIEKEAGVQGFVVRPLSAKLLDPTRAETAGIVDREKFLDIRGRSRRRQMEMAAALGIDSYPTPAGGCLLTDRNFSVRLTDLIEHNRLTFSEIELLKVGRHFRISSDTKIVVGRNKDENSRMRELLLPDDVLVEPTDFMGPDAIIRGADSFETRQTACRLVVRYSKPTEGTCRVTGPDGTPSKISAASIDDEACKQMRIGID